MNQNELYIQYLEDALNHAKTGEPMKCWQVRWMNSTGEWQDHIEPNQKRIIPDNIELRIKPEPFKWTTYAFTTDGTKFIWTDTVRKHHVSLKDLRRKFPHLNIIAVHHHEVDVDD